MSDQQHDVVWTLGVTAATSTGGALVAIWAWIDHNMPVVVGFATLFYLGLQTLLTALKIREQIRRNHTAFLASRERRTEADE